MENYDGVIGIVFRQSNPIRYLLIRNVQTGNVTFPSGGREEGEEHSWQTLARELFEETGLQPTEYTIITTPIVHEFVYSAKKKERAGMTARQPVYLVRTEKETLRSNDPDAEVKGWFTADEVEKLLTFADAKELFRKATFSITVK